MNKNIFLDWMACAADNSYIFIKKTKYFIRMYIILDDIQDDFKGWYPYVLLNTIFA